MKPTYESNCNGNCNQGRSCDCADDLAAARGIINGILLSIPIWGLIALAVWAFA